MNSLGARLALLLVIAIVGVAVLAGVITSRIVHRPDEGAVEQSVLDHGRAIVALVGGSVERARAAGLTLGSAPAPDRVDREETLRLISNMHGTSASSPIVVIEGEGPRRSLVLPIDEPAGSYVYLSYPRVPPRPIKPLVAYLSLLAAGAVAISCLAAAKIVRPLKLLEQAAASVGPDGEMMAIDETGPAEVRATAQALNRLSLRLNTAMHSRMRLVAAAGHDLRTPMTRMRLRTEFLPPEEQATWLKDLEELDRIADSAIRLVREEVSDGSSRETVEIGPMVAEIACELREVGRVVAHPPLPGDILVTGRPLALKRALRNLIDNAAAHGGGACISMTEASDTVVLTVEDTGPGIPDELLERVFEPFFRVDAGRRQSHPGAGLGFAIAREIVTTAGGSIEIANRPGGGLRQTVRLPAERAVG